MPGTATDQAGAGHGEVRDDTQKAHIFVSYKRDAEPDVPVAREVYEALQERHSIFIDTAMNVGVRWAERIEEELRRSDYLIIFLSAKSVHSEMVQAEVETAHRLAKERKAKGEKQRPVILPVRLAYQEPFKYPLSAYLDPINWAFWEGDTDGLIKELEEAISGQELAIATKEAKKDLLVASPELETPGGAMDPQSRFYIERTGDRIALSEIAKQGVTITIKGPRQVGQSSLLRRLKGAAEDAGKRVVSVDFQLFDRSDLENVDIFYQNFCTWITDELDLDDQVEHHWNQRLGNNQNCTRYIGKYLLREMTAPLVLTLDKVERLFETDFRSDFFGMLRNWHSRRRARSPWKQLDLVLVSSTEPHHFITDLRQSPFNVGTQIELADFTEEQVAELNLLHDSPLTPKQEQQLFNLVGGHPLLVRRALYQVASGLMTPSEFFAQATADNGPFGDHLKYYFIQLHGKEDLVRGLRQVLKNNKCQDNLVCFHLEGAGLVRSEGGMYLPRCNLYADYFKGHFNG